MPSIQEHLHVAYVNMRMHANEHCLKCNSLISACAAVILNVLDAVTIIGKMFVTRSGGKRQRHAI
jgi:hypothetical protein